LRIKALALAEAGHVDAACALWQRVLDSESTYDFEKASTLEHLADSYVPENPGGRSSSIARSSPIIQH